MKKAFCTGTLAVSCLLYTSEYVAAAVNACLLARAGEPYDTRLLQDVFSRSGFTDSYLTGARKDVYKRQV